MRVKVTGYIDPDPDEIDTASSSGLTGEAYDELFHHVLGAGLSDIEIEAEDE